MLITVLLKKSPDTQCPSKDKLIAYSRKGGSYIDRTTVAFPKGKFKGRIFPHLGQSDLGPILLHERG